MSLMMEVIWVGNNKLMADVFFLESPTLCPMITVTLAALLYGLVVGFSFAGQIADYLESEQEKSSTSSRY